MTAGPGADLLDGARSALPGERELLRRASGLALRMSCPESLWPVLPGEPVRVFGGTADQVRAVRQFVGQQLAGPPDAVVVASELATNSVVHSATGRPGGLFLVYAALAGDRQAAMIVTDQGGPFGPGRTAAGQDGESGRGLAVVRSLTSLFRICGHTSGHRSFIAVITTGPGGLR